MKFVHSTRARRPALAVVLALGGLAAAGVGCGEDEGRPIPAGQARDIVARLDEVERRVDARACNDVRDDSLPAIQQSLDDLPSNVDQDVRSTLEDGVGRLTELIEAECVEPPAPVQEETTTPEPDPEPQSDPTPTPDPEPDPAPKPDPAPDSGGSGSDGGGDSGGGDSGDDSSGGSDGGGADDGGGDSGSLPPDGGDGTDPTGGTDPGSTGGTTPGATDQQPA
jgi:hypothetical protein